MISVDTKKKENLGNFKNPGTEYRKQKDPRIVLDHDFPIKELGKVVPYGVYVLNENTGFINLGTDHDTAEFSKATGLEVHVSHFPSGASKCCRKKISLSNNLFTVPYERSSL